MNTLAHLSSDPLSLMVYAIVFVVLVLVLLKVLGRL